MVLTRTFGRGGLRSGLEGAQAMSDDTNTTAAAANLTRRDLMRVGGLTALGVIVNAVVDALTEYGVTHIEMPCTPERVWRAIRGLPNR